MIRKINVLQSSFIHLGAKKGCNLKTASIIKIQQIRYWFLPNGNINELIGCNVDATV